MKELKEMTPEELLAEVKKEYDESIILQLIREKGGAKVSEENVDARVMACAGCEYLGRVRRIPTKSFAGCTVCRCPLGNKAYMDRLLHMKAECPHPEGSRWEEIDSKFKNSTK